MKNKTTDKQTARLYLNTAQHKQNSLQTKKTFKQKWEDIAKCVVYNMKQVKTKQTRK